MDIITIDILKLEQQHNSSQDVINLSMNPIITSYFNKQPISWEIIHRRLLQHSDIVMKEMCRHQTLDGLPKHCLKKIHASCTILYKEKTTTINKGTTVDTSNLQTGELVHMDFEFYNATSIRGFTSMLTAVCAKIRMLLVFCTASKRAPVRIICFILKTLMHEKHPCKCVIVDEDSALANSTDVTNLLADEFKISMETTVGDASWLNLKNERHNIIIHNMVRADLLDTNQHEHKCCCGVEISAEVHRCRINSALGNISPHFSWHGKIL